MGAAVMLVSCGKDKEGPDRGAMGVGSRQKTLDDFKYNNSDIERTDDGLYTGGKRSQYDREASVAFGGDFRKSNYRTATFQSGGWAGVGNAARPGYRGKIDGSRYKTASAYDGLARQSGQRSVYDRPASGHSTYRTASATETSRTHRTGADPYTSTRRDNTPPPTIWTREEYEQLSIEHTRSLLGRDD